MYPLHLNYTTTLLCKTITMTITIFHGGSWLKTGLPPTAVTSSEKTNGHRTHQTSILLNTMSGELCLNATRHFNPSQILSTSWRKSCKQYGICHRTPSTKPYWALSKDFKLVWKLEADTLNTCWNKLFLQNFELFASCDSLKCQISMFLLDFNTSTMMKIVNFIVIVLHGSVIV